MDLHLLCLEFVELGANRSLVGGREPRPGLVAAAVQVGRMRHLHTQYPSCFLLVKVRSGWPVRLIAHHRLHHQDSKMIYGSIPQFVSNRKRNEYLDVLAKLDDVALTQLSHSRPKRKLHIRVN